MNIKIQIMRTIIQLMSTIIQHMNTIIQSMNTKYKDFYINISTLARLSLDL